MSKRLEVVLAELLRHCLASRPNDVLVHLQRLDAPQAQPGAAGELGDDSLRGHEPFPGEERVLRALRRVEPLVGVDHQQPRDQILSLGREALVHRPVLARENLVQTRDGVLEGHAPADEEVHEHAHGPHVGLLTVRGALLNLGRLEQARAHRLLLLQPRRAVQVRGAAEVYERQLPRFLLADHEVRGLEVSVDDVSRVHVRDGVDELMHERHLLRRDVLRGPPRGLFLVQLDEVLDEVPALDFLADHVDVAAGLIRAHEPEDVGVVAVGEELNLGERAGAAGGRAV